MQKIAHTVRIRPEKYHEVNVRELWRRDDNLIETHRLAHRVSEGAAFNFVE